MATKIKGFYKGLKYISQIFVVTTKERELEIGNPTDVKHVAHIGWNGPSGSAPNWMNEFKSGPEFSATSLGCVGETRDFSSTALSKWSSQDSEESLMHQSESGMSRTLIPPPDLPKKQKRRKSKTNSSQKSSSPRKGKSKAPTEVRMNLQVV